MKPAHTDVKWPPAKPAVSLSAAKSWLGIYGDDSLDDDVQAAVSAAVEKVAAHVGFRVSDTVVTDYYAGPLDTGTRLELSEPGVDWTDTPPAVKYYTRTGMLTTAANTRWKRDPTAAGNVVCWKDAAAVLYDGDLYEHRVMVVYQSKIEAVVGAPVLARVQLGIREAAQWHWSNRGQQSADAKLLDRRLSAL
ncbi:MAG: hypothetical protein OXK82_02065, partial [Deltaproteobacteria bacterium]|nr:hypothetical protein [Deltaproteobacteria bacterium]